MSELAVILLGTNLGNRVEQLNNALQLLDEKIGTPDSASQLYETAAWGFTDQPAFLNKVIGIYTKSSPLELLAVLLDTEKIMGRKRDRKWGPRIIDLDLLYFGDRIIDGQELILPHPGIPDRRFTLVPLNEIYPELIHPISGLTQMQLLEKCSDHSDVKPYRDRL